MSGLQGQTILIAGASSGMGRATAIQAAAAGARVVLSARRAEALAEVETEIRNAGGTVSSHACDFEDLAAVSALIEQVVAETGGLDAVVDTVGKNIKERSVSQLTADSWADMVSTNLTSAFHITQAVVPHFRSRGGGLIIYVSSTAAIKPDASGISYQATKAGVMALAKGTREEEKANGIRTTVIYPGMTNTPLVLNRPTPPTDEMLAKALQPEDVATACLFVLQLPKRVHVQDIVLTPSGL